jgi:hypothetical protein
VIATWRPSLRRTLLTNLVAPAIVLAVVLGIGGMMLIQRVVETTHDRLLDGSVLAIAERVGVEDGELSVDLPQVALGMLESQSHDSIYYSVTYLGELITGYKDLPEKPVIAMAPTAANRFASGRRRGRFTAGQGWSSLPSPKPYKRAAPSNAKC